MKNEEMKLLGVNVKDIVAVLAVAHTYNGRLVDSVQNMLLSQSPDFLVEYVRDELLWQNPDFLGYTDDDFVLVRYEKVEKLTLAEYIDRLRVKSIQE